MKTALLFQDGNFVGREYYHALRKAGRRPDLVIAAGRMKEESIAREVARTGGQWNPPPIPEDETVHRFEKLSDPALWDLLRTEGVDVAIQGGIGILKPDMIEV
ncbi:MAG: hypothetical protein OQJ87_10735, partial [Rhodospirillales bacterium]|nr:hypothetical protein [Rhodospirillales bacterium]